MIKVMCDGCGRTQEGDEAFGIACSSCAAIQRGLAPGPATTAGVLALIENAVVKKAEAVHGIQNFTIVHVKALMAEMYDLGARSKA